MATNSFFKQGTANEQSIVEDLIIESLKIYGMDFYYIPRTIISRDDILNEDRLSKFTSAFPIEMYFENVDRYDGQGAFMQKFGMFYEQSATLVVARKRWEQLIASTKTTTLPNRPNEGDLLYFPLSNALFEIKYVIHQDPFYQLGRLYSYKLQIELFQYNSEVIDTGIEEIDNFEKQKTFSMDATRSDRGYVVSADMESFGIGYTSATITFESTTGTGATGVATIVDGEIVNINVTNGGTGYQTPPTINIEGDGIGASAVSTISVTVDNVEGYGKNNLFEEESEDILFPENNPFGNI